MKKIVSLITLVGLTSIIASQNATNTTNSTNSTNSTAPLSMPQVFMNPYYNLDMSITDAKLSDFFHPANLFFYANSYLFPVLGQENSTIDCLYVGNRTVLNSQPQFFPNKTFLGFIAIYQITSASGNQYLRVSLSKEGDVLSVVDSATSAYIEGVMHIDDYFPPLASFTSNYKDLKQQIVSNPIWKAVVVAVPDLTKAATFVAQSKGLSELDQNKPKPKVTVDPATVRNTVAINTFSNTSATGPWVSIAQVVNDISYLELTASEITLVFYGSVVKEEEPIVNVAIYKFLLQTDQIYVYLEIKSSPSVLNSSPYADTVIINRDLDYILSKANIKLDPTFSKDSFGNGLQNIFNIPFLNFMLIQQPIRTKQDSSASALGANFVVSPVSGNQTSQSVKSA